jgi:hypothetical protein
VVLNDSQRVDPCICKRSMSFAQCNARCFGNNLRGGAQLEWPLAGTFETEGVKSSVEIYPLYGVYLSLMYISLAGHVKCFFRTSGP